MTYTVEKTLYLPAPRPRIWALLTKAELMAQWFNRPDEDLKPGGDFRLTERGSGEVLCWGQVTEMRAPSFMSWQFQVAPMPDLTSRVEWHLSEMEGGTRLHLRHTGLPQTGADLDLLRALDKGWHGFLDTLYQCDF